MLFCDVLLSGYIYFFFFNDTATTEIYTLSLHDALPIFVTLAPDGERCREARIALGSVGVAPLRATEAEVLLAGERLSESLLRDRKSTRLNSSHVRISYAVFCLKKKNIA